MKERLRIVVTGFAATYPFGGVFWDYMQYAVGLHRLGHEVLYVEDTGKWCYDPQGQTFVESGRGNAERLAAQIERLEPALANSWAFRDAREETYGRTWSRAVDFMRHADLLIHLSASCWLREEHLGKGRRVFIDSDPAYTQSALLAGTEAEREGRLRFWKDSHERFFTFGENIGGPDCRIPSAGIDWQPTRQPIVLDCFADHRVAPAARRPVLTTVASWEPTEEGPVLDGVAYGGKSVEFQRFIDLPGRVTAPVEVALSGPAPVEPLRRNGWHIIEGYAVSADPWSYRDYLATSLAELSVAKNAYVASRSGWFSCRTACYLALGVPAVVQDTGFTPFIPSGQGLFAFSTASEAQAAVESILSAPERHSAAAAEIAHEYFDSGKVLTRLVARSLGSAVSSGSKVVTSRVGALTQGLPWP